MLHVALRMPREPLARRRRRRRRRARCTRCSTGWPRSPTRCARATWRGSTGQADPQRRQHRHRRLRPRPGDGVPRAPPLQPPRPDVPLRLERRRHGLRRGDARPRPGRDAVRRLLEDVHDARDDDERRDGAAVAARRARRRRGGDRAALRRRLDEPRGRLRVRDRSRERLRVLGLGRWPLLDGLGDRALDDARDRARGVRAAARRLPRDGRALPDGSARPRTCRS